MHGAGVIGWDVGGVNTKVACVSGGRVMSVRGRPYELQRDPGALVPRLRELAAEVHPQPDTATHAVTMTAELSQMFRTKREGVAFVLDAITTAFPAAVVRVLTVEGRFLNESEARRDPLAVGAANWAATARVVAWHHPDAVLIDIGTTSTDIIPIAHGTVVATGRTDPDRLASGELVYTGAVRTPAEAIASQVPFRGGFAGVSAEGFALAGDVHVWRGTLSPADYTSPTPDGRPATREFAGERLARVVCADREMLDEAGISAIAGALADAQIELVARAARRVAARHRSLRTAVVTGLGAFLAAAAARAAELAVMPFSSEIGDAAARCAPAASVALLLDRELTGSGPLKSAPPPTRGARSNIETVVKLGGGLLAHSDRFETALKSIENVARAEPLLIVPGGGPFADAVRLADERFGPGDSAAHWMAVLAMDQHAHLIAARLNGGVIVGSATEATAAVGAGSIPVLAPYRWLRDADPLPHSWDVTSDSIAAWVAGVLGARRLVLVKPPGASGDGAVDPYFARVLPAHIAAEVISADRISDLVPTGALPEAPRR
jgi:(4-(4-[2-(gamma-L-glutamylamino)ethyl]phenoxymethyl)furan-2-yl)methanamine synthase